MQINRLFEIIYLLLDRGSVTSAELAERFEVSTRTIYRDVELLSGAGIPVYANRGRNGGISLLDRFVMDRSMLSAREQDEILFALQSLQATRADRNGELLCRLSAIFRRESPDWIDVDFSDWGCGEEETEKFRLLKNAILERQVIGFTYYSSRGEKSRRLVEPVKLHFKNSWYLQGFCQMKQDFRTFKIRRMEEVRLAGRGFEPRSGPPPLGADVSGLRYAELRLLFSPELAYRVYDSFAPTQIERREDGTLLVFVSYPEDEGLVDFLLSFGEGLTVLSPEHIRTAMRRKVQKLLEIYRPAE